MVNQNLLAIKEYKCICYAWAPIFASINFCKPEAVVSKQGKDLGVI